MLHALAMFCTYGAVRAVGIVLSVFEDVPLVEL